MLGNHLLLYVFGGNSIIFLKGLLKNPRGFFEPQTHPDLNSQQQRHHAGRMSGLSGFETIFLRKNMPPSPQRIKRHENKIAIGNGGISM